MYIGIFFLFNIPVIEILDRSRWLARFDSGEPTVGLGRRFLRTQVE
jgi:hypothetical protein